MIVKAARRYANALLQLAVEEDILDEVLNDIGTIHNTLEGSRELQLFLKSPVIKPDDKRKALETIFDEKVQHMTMQFLLLIIRKGREKLIAQITAAFLELYKMHAGILEVEVATAMELPEDLESKLQKTLEQLTRMNVEMNVETRSELLGGMTLRIDDTVIDGTVKHKISQLNTIFKEAPITKN